MTHPESATGLFQINSLWIGRSLPQLAQLCALSMLRQGHRVRLFTYGRLENVPAGIELADANAVLPEAEMLTYSRSGHLHTQLGSNVFRYRMLRQGLGLWLDMDMLLLRPIAACPAPVFGWQDAGRINNAVLFLDADSPLLLDLLEYVKTPFPVPPFHPLRPWWRLRKALGAPVHAAHLPWGVLGPSALTHFALKHRLANRAAPSEAFYPVGYNEAHGPLLAGWDTAARLGPRTLGIHLWNYMLGKPSRLRRRVPRADELIEPGSFVGRFARDELGISV